MRGLVVDVTCGECDWVNSSAVVYSIDELETDRALSGEALRIKTTLAKAFAQGLFHMSDSGHPVTIAQHVHDRAPS